MRLLRHVALGTLLWCAPAGLAAQESGIAVGSQAPAAVVESLDGQSVDLGQYLGKGPVLLQFWATWCGNCRALEPQIQAAMQKYGDRVKIVAIAVSVNQSVERIKAFRAQHGMTQEVVYDRRGYATDAYEVPATSYVVVVDAKGKVVYTGLGSDQDIDAAIRKAL
ncbi:MAG TPA: TlpA disulfide reductase family protein [Gemmatimonadaceae bacterium]|nr:TlpA disulfide reductase family protein [Gemmatimonadaceae bacterium]